MPDQAQKARAMKGADMQTPTTPAADTAQKIIAVTSGKGGVGKTNIAVNLGIALTRFGHRVLLVDADFGLGNVDLLLGLSPKYNLTHVFLGKKDFSEVLLTGPSGIRILPSSSGGTRIRSVTSEMKRELLDKVRESRDLADVVFIDTGAGITDNAIDLLCMADEVLLVTTPEPTSIMDAYGIIKVLAQERERVHIKLVVNMAEDQYDARHVMTTMQLISKQFFNVTLEELGWLYDDPSVSRAVRQQQPFVLLFPAAKATKSMNQLAMRFANYQVDFLTEHGIRGFFSRLLSHFV